MVDARHFLPFGPQSVPGQRDEPRMQDISQLGTALSITSKGVKVELDARRGEFYGPARWTLGVYDTAALAITAGYAPRVGDRVLVQFAGVGIDTPVIVAWWR